jgi:hypothetical protein
MKNKKNIFWVVSVGKGFFKKRQPLLCPHKGWIAKKFYVKTLSFNGMSGSWKKKKKGFFCLLN